jgi:hypothetical protein
MEPPESLGRMDLPDIPAGLDTLVARETPPTDSQETQEKQESVVNRGLRELRDLTEHLACLEETATRVILATTATREGACEATPEPPAVQEPQE